MAYWNPAGFRAGGMTDRAGATRVSPTSHSTPLNTNRKTDRSAGDALPLILAVAVWVPAMLAASYEWRRGEYYDYGWFVPPAAVFLMIVRWRGSSAPVRPVPWRWVVRMAVVLAPCWLVLRVLGHADPAWRMPMLLLGLLAVAASHRVIAAARGGRDSGGYLVITLLWVSALPWPTVVETSLVQWLTDQVVATVAEVFRLSGRPVEVLGDRLALYEISVEVTDGCSGVRSFQSFLMATWFFAELQRLRADRVVILLAGALATAFVVNSARSYLLAAIRFDHGQDAFERAHDWLGLLAFAVSAVLFYLMSGWLAERPRGRMVRRRTTKSKTTTGSQAT